MSNVIILPVDVPDDDVRKAILHVQFCRLERAAVELRDAGNALSLWVNSRTPGAGRFNPDELEADVETKVADLRSALDRYHSTFADTRKIIDHFHSPTPEAT